MWQGVLRKKGNAVTRGPEKDLLKRIKKYRTIYFLLLVPVAYLLVFNYLPIYGITLAFRKYVPSLGILGSPWVGFANIEKFITDPYFWKVFKNGVLISFYGLIWGFPAPIILALLFNEIKYKPFKHMVQTVTYIPNFISMVAICGMIINILSPSTGAVNSLLKFMGFEPIYFMARPEYFRTIYIASDIWQGVGFGTIIYLANLAGINPELYEAAVIDGANRFKRVWHITLPALKPIISIMLILRVPQLIGVGYEKILLLYNTNLYDVADVVATYNYRRGLLGGEFSFGVGMDLFNMVLSLTLVCIANFVASKIKDGETLW